MLTCQSVSYLLMFLKRVVYWLKPELTRVVGASRLVHFLFSQTVNIVICIFLIRTLFYGWNLLYQTLSAKNFTIFIVLFFKVERFSHLHSFNLEMCLSHLQYRLVNLNGSQDDKMGKMLPMWYYTHLRFSLTDY